MRKNLPVRQCLLCEWINTASVEKKTEMSIEMLSNEELRARIAKLERQLAAPERPVDRVRAKAASRKRRLAAYHKRLTAKRRPKRKSKSIYAVSGGLPSLGKR
jgi:hypothetical protein